MIETETHKSSCLIAFYQFGQQNMRLIAIADMIGQIMCQPVFDVLR